MRTVAIIQARMNSERLPGKVLARVGGAPLLGHVIARARAATTIDDVIVATTTDESDDLIHDFCTAGGVSVFRGHPSDVLDRYYHAAKRYKATVVVRLTADCPLLDPAVIDRVIDRFAEGGFDYVSNALPPTYPDGLDTEVFSFEALERAYRDARLPSQREHVTSYITDHGDMFRLDNVRAEADHSQMRWTVDEPEDLEFVRRVFDACGPGVFGMDAVLALLGEHPELARINQGFRRNEGYARSLTADRSVGGVSC